MELDPHPYQNHDRRCQLAATGHADYCWSYAHHVDGTTGYENMLPICRRCDQWTDFLICVATLDTMG